MSKVVEKLLTKESESIIYLINYLREINNAT